MDVSVNVVLTPEFDVVLLGVGTNSAGERRRLASMLLTMPLVRSLLGPSVDFTKPRRRETAVKDLLQMVVTDGTEVELASDEQIERRRAALKIQARARGRQGKSKVQQTRAARSIQARQRGNATRRAMADGYEPAELRDRAAMGRGRTRHGATSWAPLELRLSPAQTTL